MSPVPEMKPIESSTVHSIGFDSSNKSLHVKFKDGGHYIYDNVPDDLHSRLVNSPSVGKFIHSNVKGKYASRKHK